MEANETADTPTPNTPLTDKPISVSKELAEAQASLPVVLPDQAAPLAFTLRMLALTIAQKHVGDTVVKDGVMYQQLRMDNKPLTPVSIANVVENALVFERYLWGEWSHGIAERAMNSVMEDVAEVLEKEFRDRDPSHPIADGCS